MSNKLQIKVCGITDIHQAVALEAMGVDYIGFIFYAPSKRYVLSSMSLETLNTFQPVHAKKVGVFVNESIEVVVNTVMAAGLDVVQLHGDEDEAYFIALNNKLRGLNVIATSQNTNEPTSVVKLIKVFRVGDKMPMVESYDAVADYFLFDTDSKLYGGTGAHFNWELLKGNAINKPFFLSGGIGLDEIDLVKQILKTDLPIYAIDVNSKFEIEAGLKDKEKLDRFKQKINF
jgi:phosphoribosylanthranilate isomerase